MGPGSARSLRSLVRDDVVEASCFNTLVIASAAKQSRIFPRRHFGLLRCARNDGVRCIATILHSHSNSRRDFAFSRRIVKSDDPSSPQGQIDTVRQRPFVRLTTDPTDPTRVGCYDSVRQRSQYDFGSVTKSTTAWQRNQALECVETNGSVLHHEPIFLCIHGVPRACACDSQRGDI
jgi:hypothetical protein